MNLDLSVVKIMGTTLGYAEGLKLEGKEVSDMGLSYSSFEGSKDVNPEGSVLIYEYPMEIAEGT